MTLTDDLLAEAAAIRILGGEIVDATDIGSYAIEYGLHHHPVFPLNGKVPLGGAAGSSTPPPIPGSSPRGGAAGTWVRTSAAGYRRR